MAFPEKLQLNILHKIHNRSLSNEESSSESDSETESVTPRSVKSESGTPRSGKGDSGTPRSISGEDSSSLTSPRANLLWDHGFDVARNDRKTPEERDTEWRSFSNKTDDDKLIADRRMKFKEIAEKLREINERDVASKLVKQSHSYDLPDLIPSKMTQNQSLRSIQETLNSVDDLDTPRSGCDALDPDSDESPPPLPNSSPPSLDSSMHSGFDDDFCDMVDYINRSNEIFDKIEIKHTEEECYFSHSDNENVCYNETNSEEEERYASDEDNSSSAAGDISDREQDFIDETAASPTNYEVAETRFGKEDDYFSDNKLPQKVQEDVEAEFDFILQSLDDDKDTQETYLERLAYRRDRYGFILSPVIEAPSPTPSNFSAHSGYSGISCYSPDPLGNFRLSPGPNRTSKHELDLSSLCVNIAEWDTQQDQTVPIYQTVHAKKAFAFPEGYGWDSGDDLLSPTESVEWDADNGGLSTPPVSTSAVNLTQFGTHITGWKKPDVAIYEEPEDYGSDSTVEGVEDQDSDETIEDKENEVSDETNEDEAPTDIKDEKLLEEYQENNDDDDAECEEGNITEDSPRDDIKENLAAESTKDSEYHTIETPTPRRFVSNSTADHDYESVAAGILTLIDNFNRSTAHPMTDESVQSQLSVLEKEIRQVQNELNSLKGHNQMNKEDIDKSEREIEEITTSVFEIDDEQTIRVNSLESSLGDSFGGFSEEITALNRGMENANVALDGRCRKPVPYQSSNVSVSDEESNSNDSDEDAEDEFSGSEENDDNKQNDFDVFNAKETFTSRNSFVLEKSDAVSVSELISPRSAILLSGGMLPEESDSSTFTSEEEAQGNESPDPNMSSYGSSVKVRQYTSEDSEQSSTEHIEESEGSDNKKSKKKIAFRTSSRKQQILPAPCKEKESPDDIAQTITIHSPLDFYVFDSKLDSIKRGELRKSPRIFGRYYSEMDQEVLDKVRSQSCPVDVQEKIEESVDIYTNVPMTHRHLFQQYTTTTRDEVEELENSFQNVEFFHPKISKVLQEELVDEHGDSSEEEQTEKNNKTAELIREERSSADDIKKVSEITMGAGKTTFNTSDFEARKINSDYKDNCPDEKENLTEEGRVRDFKKIQPDVQPPKNEQQPNSGSKQSTLDQRERNNLPQEYHTSVIRKQNTQKQSSPKSKNSSPVRIKVGHLSRTGSARLKVKHGYVHELSEMFNKNTVHKSSQDLQTFHMSQRTAPVVERIPTPIILKPNENIVVTERQGGLLTSSSANSQGSFGFEVTPCSSFASRIIDINNDDVTYEGEYEDDFVNSDSDHDQKDSGDDDLKRYENRLRDMEENYYEICETHDDGETCGESHDGTKEFIPELETLTEVQTQTFTQESIGINTVRKNAIYIDGEERVMEKGDKEEEIEEIIDGETDPNQGEDEELRQKYHLEGDFYTVKDSRILKQSEDQVRTAMLIEKEKKAKQELIRLDDDRASYKTDDDTKSADVKTVEFEEAIKDTVLPNKETIDFKSDEFQPRETVAATNLSDITSRTVRDATYMEQSSIVKEIPWKPLIMRVKETESRKILPRNNESYSRKSSGYLYDLISRLYTDYNVSTEDAKEHQNDESDTESDALEHERSTDSESESAFEQNLVSSLGEKDDTNEAFDVHNTETSTFPEPKHFLRTEEQKIPTAVTETGEFEILDDDLFSNSGQSRRRLQLLNTKQKLAIDPEDPNYQIRYPSSLSKRLYGPHCRVRGRDTTLKGVNENEVERETNQSARFEAPNVEETMSKETILREIRGTFDRDFNTQKKYCPVSRASTNIDENDYTDIKGDNLSVHRKEMSFSPTGFNYTYYDVKSKSLHPTQHECCNLSSKPITDCRSNEPRQKSADCKNKFVNVKLQQTTAEAERGKQQNDFMKSAYLSNGKCDVNLAKLPQCTEYGNVETICEHKNHGAINIVDQGVDLNKVALKNEGHHSVMGVHIPQSLFTNESKQEVVDMNNDLMSTKGRKVPLNSKLHGINCTVSTATTQNSNSHLMSPGNVFNDDKRVKDGDNGSEPGAEGTHVRTSVVLQTPGFQHVLEDEKGKLRIWPYSDFDNSEKLPVTLHKAKRGINIPVSKGMSDKTRGNMTVIHSAAHSAERPENKVVQKFHSSSILPADRTPGEMMKAHGQSVQSILLQDADGNAVSEEELAAVLPKIAETISKMDCSNVEEILPGITQSITKLKNGGNLVITTMTRKLDEEESGSSGRGSPTPDYPILDVDDLEKSKIYLVQDSKGELFYVEDVTSETQESAYFSSSRNTSESVSDTGNSPTFQRISKVNSVGQSGIDQSTAEEILNAMYNESDVREMTENEEEWSERTYEFDIPRRKEYSKDAFNTSYMVEEPGDTLPKLKSATTNEKYESSCNMSGGAPWVYDGGMSQSYSQVTQQNLVADDVNSVSAVSMQNAENTGAKTIERIIIEGEAVDYPLQPQPPVFVPPMVMQTDASQYSLVKVDMTPKLKDEGVMAQIEAPKPKEPKEKLIYKTVAHIQTADKQPVPKSPAENKKYKIISSKATKKEEEQETHMKFDEMDYKFSTESVEYKMRPATTETQFFVRNSTKLEAPQSFRSEKRIDFGRKSDEKFKSQIEVRQPQKEQYEERSYSYDQMKSDLEQSESNMRVIRGSYLIKNSLDGADSALDDNINMFDGNFTLCKDNPLYHSDEDIYRKLERERTENLRRQEKLKRELNSDISFESVDRFTKTKNIKREPEKPRQSLYELLMSRLATIDTTHIKQNIDVKHNAEDIYGDPRFLHADGEYAYNPATNNFDTVGEKVDLMIKEGKAFITVKVTAERITPIDLEFNVWRKNQAIVTRTIEVDLLATEHRRRLYYKVMQEPAGGSRYGYKAGPNETILDSQQTLELFTKILGAADGEGDTEDIEIKTRSGKTTRPFTSGMDLLY